MWSTDGSSWSGHIISGATTNSYTIQDGDIGHYIIAHVQASNSGGSTSVYSAQMASSTLPSNPVNSIQPLISDITNGNNLSHAQPGDVLSTTNGAWTNSPTGFSYQWQRSTTQGGWVNVPSGGTSSTYTIQSGDVGYYLIVSVQASNSGGSGSVFSSNNTTTQILPATPSNTSLPVISGSASTGSTLSVSTGSWNPSSPTPSYTYQWKTCDSAGNNCNNISGATSSSHVVSSTDVGYTVRATVTATNAGGSVSVTTNQTALVALVNTGMPGISNSNPSSGQTLTVSTGSWNTTPTSYSYQWLNNCGGWHTIGTNSPSYAIQYTDANCNIAVTVTAYRAGGTASATPGATQPVTDSNVLASGASLYAGQFILANNGAYLLTLDAGNGILNKRRTSDEAILWWTYNGNYYSNTQLAMQTDGNLVLYSNGTPIWYTSTQGHPGAYLVIQADGNLVIYPAGGGGAIWYTG